MDRYLVDGEGHPLNILRMAGEKTCLSCRHEYGSHFVIIALGVIMNATNDLHYGTSPCLVGLVPSV